MKIISLFKILFLMLYMYGVDRGPRGVVIDGGK